MNTENKALYTGAQAVLARVFEVLPPRLAREAMAVGAGRRDFPEGLSEIRVRRRGISSLTVSGERIPLISQVGDGEFSDTLRRITDSSVYAHAATLAEGYVCFEDGVRVGISGDFVKGEGRIKNVTSMVFRLPVSVCECGEELFDFFCEDMRGMLIYSAPGGGKTSALRALSGLISRRLSLSVAVVDERYEFFGSDCERVELLRGYGKAKGIEIAKRTLAADVIIVDEIGGGDEVDAILSVGRGGIPVIATAHACDCDELLSSPGISKLIRLGFFEKLAYLYKEEGAHRIRTMRPSTVG